MSTHSASIHLNTLGNCDIVDITEPAAAAVKTSGIQDGIMTIFTPSATSGITTIENEPGCVTDLKRTFDELIQADRQYAHEAAWGDGNGHSHVRAALLGASITVPISNHHLVLGTWQQIVFVDFDNRPRQRELFVQILGD